MTSNNYVNFNIVFHTKSQDHTIADTSQKLLVKNMKNKWQERFKGGGDVK